MQIRSLVLGVAMAAAAVAQTPSLTSLLTSVADLSTLTKLVTEQKGLVDSLGKRPDITILAPTNEAFSTFLATTGGAAVGKDPHALLALLEYHVLQGKIPASTFSSTPVFANSFSQDVKYSNVSNGQVVEGILKEGDVDIISGELKTSKVVKADVDFIGGVVHIIDKVLTLPESISLTAVTQGYSAAAQAIVSAGLKTALESLADVTVFVPSNAAFEAIASDLSKLSTDEVVALLKLHVVQKIGTVYYSTQLKNGFSLTTLNGEDLKITVVDGTVFVNKAKVIIPNVLTANGVIHVIDSVLSPTASNSTSTSPTAGSSASGTVGSNKPTGSPIVPYYSAASLSQINAAVAVLVAAVGAWLVI